MVLSYLRDRVYKMYYYRYNYVTAYNEELETTIGAGASASYLVATSTGTTIYVDWTGDDATGDGSAADPLRTIEQAITACTSTGKTIIVIQDSNTYDTDVTGTHY